MDKIHRYHHEINQLKQDLLALLQSVKKIHEDALTAMQHNNYDAAQLIVNEDKDIRHIAESLTITAIWRIAQQRPFATDLRKIVGYMNIIRDLERISNYAKNISKFNAKYKPGEVIIEKFALLMKNSFKMMDLIYSGIEHDDANLAYEAAALDVDIDKLYKESVKDIIETILNSHDRNEILVYTQSIQQLKYIERLGDHLINICETLVYIHKGKFYLLSALDDDKVKKSE